MSEQHGRMVTEIVRSASLANLLGAPPEARVSVYLPPGYDASVRKRYPVLYLLHGYGSSEAEWTAVTPERGIHGRDLRGLMDSLIAVGAVKEMVIVMPNASNRLGGSFYVNSVTTGNWETFVTRDLIAHIDSTYRTMPRAESRGIAGVSMGGYGTFYLSMRHGGDTYAAMYAMSACCSVPFSFDTSMMTHAWDTIGASASFDALDRAETPTMEGIVLSIMVAASAALVPDADKPPLFFDALEARRNGTMVVNEAATARWNEHLPRFMIARSRVRLRRMRAIQFDVGAQDEAVHPSEIIGMDSAFTRAGIPHTFELYQGTHTSRITERLATHVLPFFSRNLVFAP